MFTDLVKQELGDSRTVGGDERFNCPFCGETKRRLYVRIDTGVWHCFRCSEKGNPLTFVMKYFGVSYADAIDILETYGHDVEEYNDRRNPQQYGEEFTPEERLLLFIAREGEPFEKESRKGLVCPPSPTNTKTLRANFNNPEAYPFFAYLHKRGVTKEQIETHNISYLVEGEVTLMDGRKLTIRNHLIFYTLDIEGKPMYWNTRSIDPNPFIKTFNGASGDTEHSKSTAVFNLNNAQQTDKIVITEGVFDAMTVGESGVATFGKKITNSQIELIADAVKKTNIPIYLFLDTDAGEEMLQAVTSLQSKVSSPIYFVFNPTGKDANDLGRQATEELIDNAVLADANGRMRFTLMNIN